MARSQIIQPFKAGLNPAPVSLAGDWCMIPCDLWATQAPVSAQPGNTGIVYFGQFNLLQRVTFAKMSVYVSISGTAGDKFYVGIYDKNFNLIRQGTFTSTGATGAQTITVASTTLPPGRYYLAMAGSAVTMSCYGPSFITQIAGTMNLNSTKMGFINNPVVGGNLPAVLNSSGVFTANSGVRLPSVLLEP